MNKKFTVLSIGWTSAILFFTLSPNSGGLSFLPDIPHLDKVAHLLMFAILAVFVQRSSRSTNIRMNMIWVTIIYCGILSVTTEVLQIFIPGRNCDVLDLIADMVGAGAGIFAFRNVKLS